MKVLFDPQVFKVGPSGMRRYYSTLYRGIIKAGIDIVHPRQPLFSADPTSSQPLLQELHPTINRVFSRLSFYKKKKAYYRALSHEEYDLAYITSSTFETQFLKYITDKPFVMTVHDTMQAAKLNHMLVDQSRDTMALGYLAHHAERIACVSEYTKKDLCNRYLIDEEKTQTVYLANFLDSHSEEMQNLPEKYVLFVGNRNGRKNFYEWVKAVAPSLKNQPDLYIIVTGALTEHEKLFYRKLGVLKNILSKDNVTDGQLVTLYQQALCLVYPSVYEGFGLPVIEAMANGCPVIASNCTSIPEVAGSAALYIDPLDPNSMLNAFRKLIEAPALQEELSEKGLIQSKKFSKEKFISGMIDLFEQAIQSCKK